MTTKHNFRLCVKCNHPLSDNDLVKTAYTKSNAASGAKTQLLIIADMLEETEKMEWYAEQIRKYCDWIKPIDGE